MVNAEKSHAWQVALRDGTGAVVYITAPFVKGAALLKTSFRGATVRYRGFQDTPVFRGRPVTAVREESNNEVVSTSGATRRGKALAAKRDLSDNEVYNARLKQLAKARAVRMRNLRTQG